MTPRETIANGILTALKSGAIRDQATEIANKYK
jgi:hypothetical protein